MEDKSPNTSLYFPGTVVLTVTTPVLSLEITIFVIAFPALELIFLLISARDVLLTTAAPDASLPSDVNPANS